MSREIQELRLFRSSVESGWTAEELWQKERHELQGHITTLKEQHAQMKENYDELQQQVWGADVREGRRLIADGASLAAELENLSEAEVCFYLLLSLSYCIEGFVFVILMHSLFFRS